MPIFNQTSNSALTIDLTEIEDRLTAIELENTEQNTAIAALDSRLDTLEAQPAGAPTFSREPISATTSNLAAQASEAIGIPLGKTFLLFSASSNVPARIRLYSSEAYRVADLNRAATADPSGEHGLILEAVTTASNLDLDLAPIAWGSSTSSNVAATITNLSNSAQSITIGFSRLLLEA